MNDFTLDNVNEMYIDVLREIAKLSLEASINSTFGTFISICSLIMLAREVVAFPAPILQEA